METTQKLTTSRGILVNCELEDVNEGHKEDERRLPVFSQTHHTEAMHF